MSSRNDTNNAMTNAILQAVSEPQGIDRFPHPTRTASGGFKTKEGTLYVSKPFRSGTSKKLRAMIAFTPRKSKFENEMSGANEFRGFFTLFWISMAIFAIRTYVRTFETSGYPLDFVFASMFSEDAITLALSDFALVLSTVLCVPFVKAIHRGWIKYHWTGLIIQHVWQTCLLLGAITWTFSRRWPWVQSGYLTLHTLVMIMKMHSYISSNGYLQTVHAQSESTLAELRRLTSEPSIGGWDVAIALAESHRQQLDESSNIHDHSTHSEEGSGSETNGALTPAVSEGSAISYKAAFDLRQRLNVSSNSNSKPLLSSPLSQQVHPRRAQSDEKTPSLPPTTGNSISPPNFRSKPVPHPLVDHPDDRISSLAKDYSEMQAEITGLGPTYIKYPENITYKNFAVYLLVPTLVYELEYPRTDHIRPLYVFEKTVATFGTFALLYTVTERFILPLTPSSDQSFFHSLLDLALPFMTAYLLLFYIIFECICNGFAELSYFADREFYDDWWNSTSWDEFSRKWNKPVHTFLLRHVYASTMSSYKLSRRSAMFLTFLLSAAVHELVMAIVTKKIRMYLFTMQLCQLPLIAIGKLPAIKKNKLLGNVVFWLGLYAGFPLLCVAYCAY